MKHLTPAAPFLSIADNIPAVYQKKESIKTSCETRQTRRNKTKIKFHKSTKEPFGFYSNHHSECNRCELVTLEIYFLESL